MAKAKALPNTRKSIMMKAMLGPAFFLVHRRGWGWRDHLEVRRWDWERLLADHPEDLRALGLHWESGLREKVDLDHQVFLWELPRLAWDRLPKGMGRERHLRYLARLATLGPRGRVLDRKEQELVQRCRCREEWGVLVW
ncbi:MAG: hypothetical protein VB997_09935, partial [Opitutales bacterium]